MLEFFLDKQEELKELQTPDEKVNFKNWVLSEINEINKKLIDGFETEKFQGVLENLQLLKFNMRLLDEINEIVEIN
jgi:hypothetical protein